MYKISIIIVFYERVGELEKCLNSIKTQNTKYIFEVIIVDNSSVKDLKNKVRKIYRGVKYVKSSGNIGYGAGNNLGAKYARGRYLFLLNSDTILQKGVLNNLGDFLEKNEKVAVCSPILVDKKGNTIKQIGANRLTPLRQICAFTFVKNFFPGNTIRKEYWREESYSRKPYEVEVVPGSALMIRKRVYEDLGGFDEKFFLYFEDVDLCQRVCESGYKIYKIPNARVFHDWQPSEGGKKLKQIFERSRYNFNKKHYGVWVAVVIEAFSRGIRYN